jgi:hypothetical protein
MQIGRGSKWRQQELPPPRQPLPCHSPASAVRHPMPNGVPGGPHKAKTPQRPPGLPQPPQAWLKAAAGLQLGSGRMPAVQSPSSGGGNTDSRAEPSDFVMPTRPQPSLFVEDSEDEANSAQRSTMHQARAGTPLQPHRARSGFPDAAFHKDKAANGPTQTAW